MGQRWKRKERGETKGKKMARNKGKREGSKWVEGRGKERGKRE